MNRHRALLATLASGVVLASSVVTPQAALASATSYTWVGNSLGSGGDNTSWTDARNWQPQGVPADGDSVSIAEPSASDCTAHVTKVPTVELAGFSLVDTSTGCSSSVQPAAPMNTITVDSTFSWDGGDIAEPLTIGPTAIGTISGVEGKVNHLSAGLDVQGQLELSGASGAGLLRIDAPQTLHVESGAVLTSTLGSEISSSACCVDPAHVVNDGLLEVNDGVLAIDTVELDQHKAISASPGSTLLTTAAPVTATSDVLIGGGRWAIENGAVAHFSGTQQLAQGSHFELGGLTATSDSTLGGTTTFTGNGTFDWTGGTIEANLTIGTGVIMSVVGAHNGAAARVLSQPDFTGPNPVANVTLTNNGSTIVSGGGGFGTAGAATFHNGVGGTMSLAPGTTISAGGCCTSPNRIVNDGKLIVPAGTSHQPVTMSLVSYIQRAGASASIAPGRILTLYGGVPEQLAATTVTGGGTLVVHSPTAVSGTDVIGPATRITLQDHGSLDGSATVSGQGSFDWTGGAVSGALVVRAAGGTSISGPDVKTIANVGGGSTPSSLVLDSPTTMSAGTAKIHDVLDLEHSNLILGAATRLGANTELQNGAVTGSAVLNTGTLTVAAGSGIAHKSVNGDFVNRGTVSVASGRFVVDQSYSQLSKATLSFALTSATTGALTVANLASLKGTVRARNSGAFHPTLGKHLLVVTGAALTHALTCVATSGTGSSGTGAGHWVPSFSATRFALTWRSGAHTHC